MASHENVSTILSQYEERASGIWQSSEWVMMEVAGISGLCTSLYCRHGLEGFFVDSPWAWKGWCTCNLTWHCLQKIKDTDKFWPRAKYVFTYVARLAHQSSYFWEYPKGSLKRSMSLLKDAILLIIQLWHIKIAYCTTPHQVHRTMPDRQAKTRRSVAFWRSGLRLGASAAGSRSNEGRMVRPSPESIKSWRTWKRNAMAKRTIRLKNVEALWSLMMSSWLDTGGHTRTAPPPSFSKVYVTLCSANNVWRPMQWYAEVLLTIGSKWCSNLCIKRTAR